MQEWMMKMMESEKYWQKRSEKRCDDIAKAENIKNFFQVQPNFLLFFRVFHISPPFMSPPSQSRENSFESFSGTHHVREISFFFFFIGPVQLVEPSSEDHSAISSRAPFTRLIEFGRIKALAGMMSACGCGPSLALILSNWTAEATTTNVIKVE